MRITCNDERYLRQELELKISAAIFLLPVVLAMPAPAAAAGSGEEVSAASSGGGLQLAQFQLPQPSRDGGAPPPVTQFLKYQYSFGSESDAAYRRDRDLNRYLRDNSLILGPQINGIITYRPTAWLDTTLEALLEREIAAREESVVTLPNGELQPAERRRASLAIDQAFVRLHGGGTPFELIIGRRNFEDERRWLFDTSLDAIIGRFKNEAFQLEASLSRKDRYDLDLLKPISREHINNTMLYLEYRGIADTKLAAYAIRRRDYDGNEGRPLFLGLRAIGSPSAKFSYWGESALLRGSDEQARDLHAYGFDFGSTVKFPDLALSPNLTVGYAYGSGDDAPNNGRNTAFRQTGLQSNETRFAGVSKFKTYGEALDPELSNLQILTLGLGFRATPSSTVDLVYHHYRLNRFADALRNSALTAEINQIDAAPSKKIGNALDLVIGLRNVFGVRKLGIDLRAGLFFPGNAYRRNDGTDEDPQYRNADKGISVLAKFWW